MTRGPFTVAHRRQSPFGVYVVRTHTRATLRLALLKAVRIHRAGYLAWVEQTGWPATR